MAGLALSLGFDTAAERPAGLAESAPFTPADLPADSTVDHDPASLPPGPLASWPASAGAGTFVQALAGRQPTVVANGWGARKVVSFDGLNTTPDMLVGDEALVETAYHLLVAYRGAAQNGVATSKTLLEAPRLSDGKVGQIRLLRSTNDPEQDNVLFAGIGGAAPTSLGGFTVGAGAIVTLEMRAAACGGSVNGGAYQQNTQDGTATAAAVALGANPANTGSGAAFALARRLRVDLAKLPGGQYQEYNRKLLEGWAAWEYGLDGDPNLDLVAKLPAGHPFKARRPRRGDWLAFPITPQKWGNSLGNGAGQQSATAWDAANRGLTIQNGCVGGLDSAAILALIADDLDQGNTNSGLPPARIREKVHYLSDLRENDTAIGYAAGRANIASIVALLEAGQGVAAGQGRIVFWGRWRGNGLPGNDDRLAGNDAELAVDLAEYPDYVIFDSASGRHGMGQILAYDARPGGPAEDADAWARGVIPAAYRASGGIHLTTPGYLRAAEIERAFALSKGWTI